MVESPSARLTIFRYFKKYLHTLHSLPSKSFHNCLIDYHSINSFLVSSKEKNDAHNKIRESLVGLIINKQLDSSYFRLSRRWSKLQKSIYDFINNYLVPDKIITNMKCFFKGGRKYNYDFVIIINDLYDFKIELKFNATSVDECPQFSSPMYPSKYLNQSFESFYYEHYLPRISEFGQLPLPPKETYLNEIHGDSPPCMTEYKKMYKDNNFKNEFVKFCRRLDKESNRQFLNQTTLDTDKLSSYLLESQQHKIYMLYKDGQFYHQRINESLYKIIPGTVVVKSPNYLCQTESGQRLEVKLRWKNYCGIAFPAFQISEKKNRRSRRKKKLVDTNNVDDLSLKLEDLKI